MLPTAVISSLLTFAVLTPALPTISTTVGILATAKAHAHPSSDTDDWADRALANPESDRGWGQPRNDDWGDRREAYCVVRELPYTADEKPIAIDGGENGGVEVQGWDRKAVRVLYRVKARARSAERAKELAESIDIVRSAGKVRSDGPATSNREWWSVEFRVWVPRSSDLWLRAHNGPLGVASVRGTMDIATVNGPLSLVDVSGAVEAHTDNGPLHVELEGARWEGAGLDASTQNGPVNFELPRNYSALVETGTVNGPSTIDYVLTVRRLRGHITAKLGSGGPPVRVVTDNGPFQMTAR